MKKYLLYLLFLLPGISLAQSVAINTDGSAPAGSAILDIKSTAKGLLIPRMTMVNRNAIGSPATGLMIYQTDNSPGFYFYNGVWTPLSGGASANYWALDNLNANIYNTNPGKVYVGTTVGAGTLTVKGPLDASWLFLSETGTTSADYLSMGIYASGGTSSTRFGSITGNFGNGFQLANQANAPLIFQTNSSERMRITGGGNVGINTQSPTTKLEVLTGDANFGIIHTNGTVSVGTYVGSSGGWIATQSLSPLYFCTGLLNGNNSAQITLLTNGNVGIGTLSPTYKLSVSGTIQTKEVRVETGWADYVFDEDYKLKPLSEVEDFIQANKHLEGIPTAKEIQDNGLPVGEVQTKMMQKIEELTLYVIELEKQVKELKKNMK